MSEQSDDDKIARIQKLLALAGNNPSLAEAKAAWAKAQVLIKKLHENQYRDPTDAELERWFVDSAMPCPWTIKVMTGINGREYVTVADASMLTRPHERQTLPTWRLVPVPLAFRRMSASEILQACLDGKIHWQSPKQVAA